MSKEIERREAGARTAHLKTSPNLSATTIVRPGRVNRIWVAFFGISLRVLLSRKWTELIIKDK